MDISTECRWRQSLVGFYQLLENIQKQMFAILMKPKKVTLLSPHIWTYMNVVVTCKFTLNSSIVSYRKFVRPNGLFGCQHNKNLTIKQQSNKHSQSHLIILGLHSQMFVLYFIFVHISSSFLLQLLLTVRNPQTFHPVSVLFFIPEVDQLFHCDIVFRCFVSSTPTSRKVFQCILMTLVVWQFNLNGFEISTDISMDLSMISISTATLGIPHSNNNYFGIKRLPVSSKWSTRKSQHFILRRR